MQGKRVDRIDGSIPQPGEYGKDATGNWQCMPPGTNILGGLNNHQVTEHEDGTITVAPSILITYPHINRVQWHGYLERGVWREV